VARELEKRDFGGAAELISTSKLLVNATQSKA